MKELDATSLKVIYPKEYTTDDLGTKILLEILAFFFVCEFSGYLFGIFFIVYVILSKVYRFRIKDYSILRTLGITKGDMAKIVNVEMKILGYGTMILTYLIYNGLIYSMNGIKFFQQIGLGVFLAYFAAMYLFTISMAKRFNKHIFKFTVRETVRGDDDND